MDSDNKGIDVTVYMWFSRSLQTTSHNVSSPNLFYQCILYVLLTTSFCVYVIIDFFHPTFQSVSELIINKQNTMKRADVDKGMIAATYNGISAGGTMNKMLFYFILWT